MGRPSEEQIFIIHSLANWPQYPATVPIDPKIKYSVDMADYIDVSDANLPYRQVLGGLLYATQAVRLDAGYAVQRDTRIIKIKRYKEWRRAIIT